MTWLYVWGAVCVIYRIDGIWRLDILIFLEVNVWLMDQPLLLKLRGRAFFTYFFSRAHRAHLRTNLFSRTIPVLFLVLHRAIQ